MYARGTPRQWKWLEAISQLSTSLDPWTLSLFSSQAGQSLRPVIQAHNFVVYTLETLLHQIKHKCLLLRPTADVKLSSGTCLLNMKMIWEVLAASIFSRAWPTHRPEDGGSKQETCTTRLYNSEDIHIHNHRHKNLKSHKANARLNWTNMQLV